MPKYLLLDQAKEYLSYEDRPDLMIPEDPRLIFLIDQLEIQLDHWLRCSLAPTLFQEILQTNYHGNLAVRHYPVLCIIEVKHVLRSQIKTDDLSIQAKMLNPKEAGYEEYRFYKTPAFRRNEHLLDVGAQREWMEVIYWAGYDPIPPVVSQCIYLALLNTLYMGGSITALFQPARILSSQSLPGGLSQNFTLPQFREGEYSMLDHFFYPLKMYRRDIIW